VQRRVLVGDRDKPGAPRAVTGGLDAPKMFGKAKPNRPSPSLPMLDNVELRIPADAQNPPPVALFDVQDAVPQVRGP